MVDRSKRYQSKQGKSGAPGGTAEGKSEAEKTAGSGMPHEPSPGPVGKEGSDPGPEGGHDATWGVVADRHKREHGDMLKRHADEHASMVERHAKEGKDMHVRHQKDMQDHMAAGAAEAEKTAGSPKILGETKSEGTKGSEV